MAYGSLRRRYLRITCPQAVSAVKFPSSEPCFCFHFRFRLGFKFQVQSVLPSVGSNQTQMCSAVQNQVSMCWLFVICNSGGEPPQIERCEWWTAVTAIPIPIRIPIRIPIPTVHSQQFAHIPLALSMRLVGSWLMMTKVGAPWKAERNGMEPRNWAKA